MKYAFINQHQADYQVALMCRVMGVSRSGFYDYLKRMKRPATAREVETSKLITSIKDIHRESKQRYGSPRIHAELKRRGQRCSLPRVKRLMRTEGIYAVPKRKFTLRKTPTLTGTTNLLSNLDITRANQVWYSDITYIKTQEGWLYLAAVMDAYSKRIVGYAIEDHMRTDLVLQALRMAATQRRVSAGLIHHSDKGSQYTSYPYQRDLSVWGMKASFTGTGACLDNAHIESFFATLKKELVYQTSFQTKEQARLKVIEFINMYYNGWRLHSSLGYQTPNEFESQHLELLAA